METRSSIKNILYEKLITKIALHYKTFIGGGMFSRISYVGMVEIFVPNDENLPTTTNVEKNYCDY